MILINLTPHTITLHLATTKIDIEPSGKVARVEMQEKRLGDRWVEDPKGTIYGLQVPILSQTPKAVDIPEPQFGIGYLVSAIVLAALKGSGRDDVFAPDTNNAHRNAQGHIVSVPGLVGIKALDIN